MRARLALLLALLPVLALAQAAPGGDRQAPAPKPPAATASSQTAANVAQAPSPPLAATAPADPADCRMTCAQSYYFCSSNYQVQDCSPAWSQCVAACELPNLDPGVSTAP